MARSGLALALSVSATACSFPDGRPQEWPPDTTIGAILATDLDGDTIDDLVVFGSGSASIRGAYVAYSSRSLSLEHPVALESFDSFDPLSRNTAAATLLDRFSIATISRDDAQSDNFYVDLLSATGGRVREIASVRVSGTAASAWLRGLTIFGRRYLLVGTEAGLWALPTSPFGPAREIPGPSGAFSNTRLATIAKDTMLVVASPTTIDRALLSGEGVETITAASWQRVRDGAVWEAQAAFDIDRDGTEEILGLDQSSFELCAAQTSAESSVPSCIATAGRGEESPQLVATRLAADQTTIVVIYPGTVFAIFERLRDCSLNNGVLAATTDTPVTRGGQGAFHLAVIEGAFRFPLIAIDHASYPYCIRIDGPAVSDCSE